LGYNSPIADKKDELMGHYDEYENRNLQDDVLGFTLTNPKDTHATFGSGAQKDIAGKARFDLIPPEAMKSLAEVYALGAEKYSDRNWEKGIPFSAAIAALKRHLNSFELGDMINTNDGDHEHIAHVMWWAVALITFIKRGRTDLNDLPHYQADFNNEKSN
jgi:hypothetical protein